ncbi:hypothetical protein IAU60_001063 [Kwoniella sp. DSM 27419]
MFRLVASRSLHTISRLLATPPSLLETTLRDALKASMKARDRPASACLKAILADVTNAAKSGPTPNEPGSQESVMTVIKKGISQRTQAAESYAPTSASPHPDNHSSLLNEINLLKSFLPTGPTAEVIQAGINKIIAALPGDVRGSKSAAGKVMSLLWEELGEGKAAVDKKEVGKWVQEALKK